jgi:hypothetical protein
MSFEKMTTELGVMLLAHQPRKAPRRMTFVSAYYRKICEPLLYKNIRLYTHRDGRIRQLVVTLLCRKDLRFRVNNFTLRYNHTQRCLNPLASLLVL